MSDEIHLLRRLLQKDCRYPIEAYFFVREALSYAVDSLALDTGFDEYLNDSEGNKATSQVRQQRHVTGQQLCDGIRQYAINQFGFMAKVVLKSWGIERTNCFGDIVYNMIDVGIMKKSSDDRRSHFDDVYDFDEVFQKEFAIGGSFAQRRS